MPGWDDKRAAFASRHEAEAWMSSRPREDGTFWYLEDRCPAPPPPSRDTIDYGSHVELRFDEAEREAWRKFLNPPWWFWLFLALGAASVVVAR